jgi:hypothetical protein
VDCTDLADETDDGPSDDDGQNDLIELYGALLRRQLSK